MDRPPDRYAVAIVTAREGLGPLLARMVVTVFVFSVGFVRFFGVFNEKILGVAVGVSLGNLLFGRQKKCCWFFETDRRLVSWDGGGHEARYEDCAEVVSLEAGGAHTLFLVTRDGRHLRLSEAEPGAKPPEELLDRARTVAAILGVPVASRTGSPPDPFAIEFKGPLPVTASTDTRSLPMPTEPAPPPPPSSLTDTPTLDTPIGPPSSGGSVSAGRVSMGRVSAGRSTGPIFSGIRLPNSDEFRTTYEPVRHLGRGAMGDVLLMKQLRLDRLVAVKFVRAETLSVGEAARIEKEAKILAKLSHPGILGIFDVRADETIPYMVCEYVDGETLADRMRRTPPLTLPQTLEIAATLLDALDTAHRKGIVHRDLKPGNIFLTSEGKPKIGDFGLAKAQAIPSGGSVGKLIGTPAYMSPEQCRGASATESSDLYALGVVLFEMVTGQRPYPGPELYQYLSQHTSSPIPSASDIKPQVPPQLSQLIARALAKEPAQRPANAAQFRTELAAIR